MSKKVLRPISPLQALTLQTQNEASFTFDVLTANENEVVHSVDPSIINNWSYHDRPDNELGDLDELARDMLEHGQIQPCIVRLAATTPPSQFKYELIVGERRWRAALKANIKLKIIIRNLDNHSAAILQAGENDQRQDLSEYAKGMSYAKLIEAGILARDDLLTKLNKSKSTIRNLLAFARIDADIKSAIVDLSKLSAATAYEITRIAEKGPLYKDALLAIAPLLRGNNISDKRLANLVQSWINQQKAEFSTATPTIKSAHEITSKDGRHIFTWRNNSRGTRFIAFPKNISPHINFKELEELLITNIEKQLSRIRGE
jgi:ParB family chromosome partitioning protein